MKTTNTLVNHSIEFTKLAISHIGTFIISSPVTLIDVKKADGEYLEAMAVVTNLSIAMSKIESGVAGDLIVLSRCFEELELAQVAACELIEGTEQEEAFKRDVEILKKKFNESFN